MFLFFLYKERTKEIPDRILWVVTATRPTSRKIFTRYPPGVFFRRRRGSFRASHKTRFRVSLLAFFAKDYVLPVPGVGAGIPLATQYPRFRVSLPTFFAKKVGHRSSATSSFSRSRAAGGCPGALAADKVPKVAALPKGPPQ